MVDFSDPSAMGDSIVRSVEPTPEQQPVRSSEQEAWMMYCGSCGAVVESDESELCVQCRCREEQKNAEVSHAVEERERPSCRIGEHRDRNKSGEASQASGGDSPKRGRKSKKAV